MKKLRSILRRKFLQCQKTYKPVETIADNYSTLAGFYVLECSRRQFDLEALSHEQKSFRKAGLTRETHLQQLEINAFWELARQKNWDQLDRLAQAWLKRKVSGTHRAQIDYCHGLALEGLSKDDPKRIEAALNAYNSALSADFTASTEIVIAAVNNALKIYLSDAKVKQAMTVWGTENERKNGYGYRRLIEASALANLYTKGGFNSVKPLTEEGMALLKYEGPKKPKPVKKEPAKEAADKVAPAKKAATKETSKKKAKKGSKKKTKKAAKADKDTKG
jgi:hypothetical protein